LFSSGVPRRWNSGSCDSNGKRSSYRPFNISTGTVTRGAKLSWCASGSSSLCQKPPEYIIATLNRTALLEVSEPRAPCWKLGVKMEDAAFPRKFTKAGRPGAYLRIVREGVLAANDPILVVDRPGHGVRVKDVFRIYTRERKNARLLLEVPELSEDWKEWARRERG